MEEAEKDAKAIKMATGWERGSDGKWRYETSDIKPKPFEEWMDKKNLKLGDIIDSDSGLFEMYPELKDFKVTRGKGKSTNAAIYTGLGKIDMTMLEDFVKERNEALFSLDRKKIEAYMIKYGETEIAQTPDNVFWASVYKAICGIKDAPEAIVSKAKAWLHEHGMSPNLAG